MLSAILEKLQKKYIIYKDMFIVILRIVFCMSAACSWTLFQKKDNMLIAYGHILPAPPVSVMHSSHAAKQDVGMCKKNDNDYEK